MKLGLPSKKGLCDACGREDELVYIEKYKLWVCTGIKNPCINDYFKGHMINSGEIKLQAQDRYIYSSDEVSGVLSLRNQLVAMTDINCWMDELYKGIPGMTKEQAKKQNILGTLAVNTKYVTCLMFNQEGELIREIVAR